MKITINKDYRCFKAGDVFDFSKMMDNGLSLKNQSIYQNFIWKMTLQYKCDVLVISHNPFFISQSDVVYNLPKKEFVLASDYIKEITGYELTKIEKPKEE